LQHYITTVQLQGENDLATEKRQNVIESRKQAISIRMNAADVRKVKKLAQRLGVRDSDVIRFAVKCMLARLGPLYDPEVKGRNLVPVFVESGSELLRFFELDAARLDAIINGEADVTKRVDRDDIALLALSGAQEPYAALMLSELSRDDRKRSRVGQLSDSLRQYLYEKYVYRGNGEGAEDDDQAASLDPIELALVGARHD
jgi:hypothetical protein